MKQIKRELKTSGKTLLFGLCLTLMSSVVILPAFAGTWFSKSRFAYFGGDILLWGSQETEGLLVAGPKDAIPGEDPWIYMAVNGWNCYMTEFSNVQIDFEEKDYLAVGTWEIQKGTQVHTDNASDITPYMSGLGIAKVAIVTWQADISDMENILTSELNITDITVIYFTPANETESFSFGKRPDETGKFAPGYVLSVDGLRLGDIDMGFDKTHNHTDWGGYFDSVIFVEFSGLLIEGKWGGLVETRIEVNLPSVTSYVPGDVYVTGNWTDFAADVEDVGTFSGKVTGGNVKYGSVEYAWPSYPPANSTHSDPDPRADVNGDNVVNIIDLARVAQAFGATKDTERYDPKVDINSDAVINILDIAVVAKNFGSFF